MLDPLFNLQPVPSVDVCLLDIDKNIVDKLRKLAKGNINKNEYYFAEGEFDDISIKEYSLGSKSKFGGRSFGFNNGDNSRFFDSLSVNTQNRKLDEIIISEMFKISHNSVGTLPDLPRNKTIEDVSRLTHDKFCC